MSLRKQKLLKYSKINALIYIFIKNKISTSDPMDNRLSIGYSINLLKFNLLIKFVSLSKIAV